MFGRLDMTGTQITFDSAGCALAATYLAITSDVLTLITGWVARHFGGDPR
jgi:hypothetical protein